MTTPVEEPLTAVTDPDNCDLVVVKPANDEAVAEVPEEVVADGSDHSRDGMIALLPSRGNAERLACDGGEHPDDLHATVLYIDDAGKLDDEEAFGAVMDSVVNLAMEHGGPVIAEGFNVSMFNPHREDRQTCVTLGLSGSMLHALCRKIQERVLDALERHSVELAEQHEPWIPHVTLAYSEDFGLAEQLADRAGELTFDRIRVTLGDDVYDIDLIDDGDEPDDEMDDESDDVVEIDDAYDGDNHDEYAVSASAESNSVMYYNDRGGEVVDTEETEGQVEATPGEPGAWSGILIVEGVESGDGRMFAEGSLKSAPLPLPLMWQKQTDEGHKTAVQAGRIDEIWREGNEIWGRGVFDLEGEDGQEAYRQVAGGFLRGVSGDVDSVKDSDVEMVFPKSKGGEDSDVLADMFGAPELTVFHNGRLRGATLVQFPAFVEASIALEGQTFEAEDTPIEEDTQTEFAIVPRGETSELSTLSPHDDNACDTCGEQVSHLDERAELTACGCTDSAPPADWFANPQLSGPTPMTVLENGQIFGHAAIWGTCHTGFSGTCVTPPRERHHEYFRLGETLCADGSTVATGTITLGTGHAATGGKITPFQAIDHYDHTGTVVADVATGEDEHGLWFAGAIRPNTPPTKLRALRAAKLSGDWRRFGNGLRLIALLAVNVPGFPVPRIKAGARRGIQTSLVAAGINHVTLDDVDDREERELFMVLTAGLRQRVKRDEASRLQEMRNRVHGR